MSIEFGRGAHEVNVIRISIDGKNHYYEDARMERIVRWLVCQAEKIRSMDRAQITFHCAGSQVKYDLVESGEA